MLLDRPEGMRGGRRADRAGRLVVRVDEGRRDVNVLELVWTTGMHRGELGEEAALAAVGAAVEHEPAAAGDDRPVPPRAALALDHHSLAPGGPRDEFLLARGD